MNVFDKATGTVSPMKSEGTKEAVESSYYAKKRSVTGQETGGRAEFFANVLRGVFEKDYATHLECFFFFSAIEKYFP